jgi:hypothetical protein
MRRPELAPKCLGSRSRYGRLGLRLVLRDVLESLSLILSVKAWMAELACSLQPR